MDCFTYNLSTPVKGTPNYFAPLPLGTVAVHRTVAIPAALSPTVIWKQVLGSSASWLLVAKRTWGLVMGTYELNTLIVPIAVFVWHMTGIFDMKEDPDCFLSSVKLINN